MAQLGMKEEGQTIKILTKDFLLTAFILSNEFTQQLITTFQFLFVT